MDSQIKKGIITRLFRPEDAEGVTQLIYRNYDNTYYKSFYYDPDAIRKANNKHTIISIVADKDSQLVGHFAMIPSSISNIAEIGAAVVDPEFKHMGIMNEMFDEIVTNARGNGYSGLYGEGMMLHPFSQKANLHHGMIESAIMLGEVPSSMEIEHRIKDTKRSGVVVAFLLFNNKARNYYLPARYREIIEKTCHNGGLEIKPSDLYPIAQKPALSYRTNPLLKTGTLVIENTISQKELEQVLQTLTSGSCDMIFADINLHRLGNIDYILDILRQHRFFYSGIMFSLYSDEDYLRLQRKTETEIDEAELVCYSPFSQTLLTYILEDEASVT